MRETINGIILPPCFYHWEGEGVELCDLEGTPVPIPKGQCEHCDHYAVMSYVWDKHLRDLGLGTDEE